jgi:hypothetical protein
MAGAPELTGHAGKGLFMVIVTENKQPLNEKLEPATKQQFDLLQKQIDSDQETKKMLTTPMVKIPQYYWLYSTEHFNVRYVTLLLALKGLYESGMITMLFSKAGNKFTGFLSYREEGNSIIAIKIASFKDDEKKSNVVLTDDLIKFVEKEACRRSKIEWVADKENNYANNQYERLLNKKKFIWNRVSGDGDKIWVYTVTGKSK